MQENVGFWRLLMVSRSKSSWSPPTFQRFSPELSQQSTKSRKFQFQIAFSVRNKWNQVGSVWDLLKETPWKSFPLEFSAPTQEEKGFIFQGGFLDGVSTYMFLNHEKTRSNASAFTEFSFLQNCDLSKLPIDPHRAPPCDLGFSTLLLHYGWIEVEGVWCVKIVWMIKNAYFRWRRWLVSN